MIHRNLNQKQSYILRTAMLGFAFFIFCLVACGGGMNGTVAGSGNGTGNESGNGDGNGNGNGSGSGIGDGIPLPTGAISPDNLNYLGAFRLPGDGWAWGGLGLTYYPEGDPDGANDGTSGSLFGAGFNLANFVSEITIPTPVISPNKNLDDLNTATTLQDFTDLRLPVFQDPNREIPRIGLAYLPAQGNQDSGKLYHTWGQHFEDTTTATHTWSDVDLSAPNIEGPWRIAGQSFYSVNDYMFEIPKAWADTYTGGRRIATGRFRDGGWSGQGPSLFAIAPWEDGNPPAANSEIDAVTLIQYGVSDPGIDHCNAPVDEEGNVAPDCTAANQNPDAQVMDNYHHSDEWSGGAWLSAGDQGAVIFVGTKGTGDRYWYGSYEGPCFACGDLDRGWYSGGFEALIIFYDPADLARVAQGNMDSSELQPYGSLNIDEFLFSSLYMRDNPEVPDAQQKYRLGAVTFDANNGRLYIVEQFADGEKPIIHVWEVGQ